MPCNLQHVAACSTWLWQETRCALVSASSIYSQNHFVIWTGWTDLNSKFEGIYSFCTYVRIHRSYTVLYCRPSRYRTLVMYPVWWLKTKTSGRRRSPYVVVIHGRGENWHYSFFGIPTMTFEARIPNSAQYSSSTLFTASMRHATQETTKSWYHEVMDTPWLGHHACRQECNRSQ